MCFARVPFDCAPPCHRANFSIKNPKHRETMLGTNFKIGKIRGTTQIRENLTLCVQPYTAQMITEAHPVEAYLPLRSVRPRKSIRVFPLTAIAPSAALCKEESDVTPLSQRFEYGIIIARKRDFVKDFFCEITFLSKKMWFHDLFCSILTIFS